MLRIRHKHWKLLVKEGLLDEAVLQPGSFITDAAIRTLKYSYPDHLQFPTPIKRDTLFWYPGKKEVAALYLQNRITQAAQDMALKGLREMEWQPPKSRPETRAAVERQQEIGGIPPG